MRYFLPRSTGSIALLPQMQLLLCILILLLPTLVQSQQDADAENPVNSDPAPAFASNWQDTAEQYRRELIQASKAAGVLETSELLIRASEAEQAGRFAEALAAYRLAAGAAPDDPQAWLRLGRAIMQRHDPDGPWHPDADPALAVASAHTAWSVSTQPARQAESLALLGDALIRVEDGRAAIQAYTASLELESSTTVQAELAKARARFGFRILGNSVDTDTRSPRLCVQFSENLIDTDYTPFVMLDGQKPPSVEADGRQLCIDGLAHGQRYALSLRQGLPSEVGEELERPVTLNVFVRDRAPEVRFAGSGRILPAAARQGIPLVSVNTDRARLELFHIPERNLAPQIATGRLAGSLSESDLDQLRENAGASIWQGDIELQQTLNESTTTSFPLQSVLPEPEPGLYILSARLPGPNSDGWAPHATQWFLVSDIGLTTFTGQDGLDVFARSLDSADPLSGVELTLIARDNEVLATARTDSEGHARFQAGQVRGQGASSPALVTAATTSGDHVFLDLTRASFDLSDRGVTGRPAAGAMDVLAWTDRGIYRAGERVHAQALLRDHQARAISDLPLQFRFVRPDGVEYRRESSSGSAQGGHLVSLALQANAPRGRWSVQLFSDPESAPLAEADFLVEDFVPDRLALTLALVETIANTDAESLLVDVEGRYLYGAPAAGLALEGETTLRATRRWAEYPGYQFGLTDEQDSASAIRQPLTDTPALNDDGKARLTIPLDQPLETTQRVEAELQLRLRESGGRAIERQLVVPVTSAGSRIGIRPLFDNDQVAENGVAAFRVIGVDTAGERVAMKELNWTLSRLDQQYQWYRRGERWDYEPIELVTRVADGMLDTHTDKPARLEAPVGWGRFRLEIRSNDPTGPISSVEFNAGFQVAGAGLDTPDALDISLQRASHDIDQTAQLRINPRFAGKALITVGAERLLKHFSVDVPAAGLVVPIPVEAQWGAGVYVTATLFRPGAAGASREPARAMGVAWLGIDPEPRTLPLQLAAPGRITPGQTLSVELSLPGTDASNETWVSLALVDAGILSLTGHESPDPARWYYGQRRLGLELRDLYGQLIDGSAGQTGRVRSGGDAGLAGSRPGTPVGPLLAQHSGLVRLDDQGQARIDFELPEFNGTARLMAVAWNDSEVGHAVQDVLIRNPVVMTASLPRFLNQGDQASGLLELVNTDGPAGEYALQVTTTGALAMDELPERLTLASGQRLSLPMPLDAHGLGTGTLKVQLTHVDGLTLVLERTLTVQPGTRPRLVRTTVPIAANGGEFAIDAALLNGLWPDTATIRVGVSGHATFDVPSLLLALQSYPYGCAEQTTSQVLPLLYTQQLTGDDNPALASLIPDDVPQRIESAIERLMGFQASNGSFGLWAPDSGDLWLDAYISDFLTRAREAGHDVPEQSLLLALDNLQNALAYYTEPEYQGSEIAYALYVLARNRRASLSDLRYYAESRLAEFESPLARAQLGASLALYSDHATAQHLFDSALELVRQQARETGSEQWSSGARADYGTALRDAAGVLALAAETRPAISGLPGMIDAVVELQGRTRANSTQDNVWLAMAARASMQADTGIDLSVDDQPHQGRWAQQLTGAELAERTVRLVNRGPDPVEAVITTMATPVQPVVARGEGFGIERRHYDLAGHEISLERTNQNQRVVVVLSIEERNSWPSRLVIASPLPAGFELDNPALVGSAELERFDWLEDVQAAHSEYRDDRFIVALNRNEHEPRRFQLAYVMRAVTPGDYALPAASVDDMYRPELSARTGAARVSIKAQ